MISTPLFDSFLSSILIHVRKRSEDQNLDALNFQIRFFVTLLSFLIALVSPFITGFHILFHTFFLVITLLHFYQLLYKKDGVLLGLPYITTIFFMSVLVFDMSDCYLCVLTASLGVLTIFSIQGYSPHHGLIFGIGLVVLQRYLLFQLADVYEPITDSYRISAAAIHGALKGWHISLTLEVICLVIFQIITRKMWSRYQGAKKDLEEINRQLVETNKKLQKNIEELELQNRELTQVLKSRDLFVACVSHDFRNPLNVLLSTIEQLYEEVKDQTHSDLLRTCKICGEVLLKQVNNLLDASRLNADKLEISNTATKISIFFDKIWAFTKVGLDKKGLSGHLTVDKNVPLWLNLDSHRLHQILDNLIGNAIKFTTEGSVRLTIYWIQGSADSSAVLKENRLETGVHGTEADQAGDFEEGARNLPREGHRRNLANLSNFISFRSRLPIKDALEGVLKENVDANRGFLRIDIVDTGCGVSKEEQLRIFDPFEQANTAVSRRFGGTGLGLFIVKKIIDKMEGTINMTSMKDVGTRFQLVIPVAVCAGTRE